MSILIKSMEMPKNCEECFFLGTDNNAHWYCYCQKKKISITSEKAYDGYCPLIELPPHGDLIDRYAAIRSAFKGEQNIYCWDEIEEAIDSVPTIIEREE